LALDCSVPNKMNKCFVLNATSIVIGGGIQAVVSFIQTSLKKETDVQWIYVLSKQVHGELEKFDLDLNNSNIYVFDKSPAKSLATRNTVKKLVDGKNANAVFTFFGPAHIDFKTPHLLGVANGWVTHSNYLAFTSLGSILKKIKVLLLIVYLGFWYRKADRWVVEAACAKKGLMRRMRLHKNKIDIVSNTCGDHYCNFLPEGKGANNVFRILTLSSYYPHKNLEIIPLVSSELADLFGHKNFKFIITIPFNTKEEIALLNHAKHLNVETCLENIGPVDVVDGPRVYDESDVVFLPSLLETFSANYPEAMVMNKPIVTTDLDFSHDACGDAASYFKAKDAGSAASCIYRLLTDAKYAKKLTDNGQRQLSLLPDQDKKYSKYVNILNSMCSS